MSLFKKTVLERLEKHVQGLEKFGKIPDSWLWWKHNKKKIRYLKHLDKKILQDIVEFHQDPKIKNKIKKLADKLLKDLRVMQLQMNDFVYPEVQKREADFVNNLIKELEFLLEEELSKKSSIIKKEEIAHKIRNYFETLIKKTKNYLRDKSKLKDALNFRIEFLREFVKGKPSQEEVLKVSKNMLKDSKYNEEEKLIIEYESSYFGVNPKNNYLFTPSIILYLKGLKDPRVRIRISLSQVRSKHLIRDMDEFEEERIGYYLDYKGKKDLGGKDAWFDKDYWPNELRPEITNFLRNKKKILEVGFLHQNIYDLIKEINPSIEYHCVDISIPAVLIARRKNITAFNCNAWYAIPYPDNYFDGIIASTIKVAGLRPNIEMKRVLKDKRNILNLDLQ